MLAPTHRPKAFGLRTRGNQRGSNEGAGMRHGGSGASPIAAIRPGSMRVLEIRRA